MNSLLYNRLVAAEGIDQHEEETRLEALFAQIKRVVRGLVGIEFHHLQPGEIGHFRKMEWNAYLYLRAQDRVFPFRVVIEPGRHSSFRLKIHPDLEQLTDFTVLNALSAVMRLQLQADDLYLRLNHWHDHKEEPVFARVRCA